MYEKCGATAKIDRKCSAKQGLLKFVFGNTSVCGKEQSKHKKNDCLVRQSFNRMMDF